MHLGTIPLAVLFAAAFISVGAAQPPSDLDRKSIHAAYNEGDFESVIARIEAFTSAHPTYAKDDSVFIAKHLAVVYTANPATREKGKHYMFLLLELSPSAKIVDMFVSDEIDRIFERVKEEFAVRQNAAVKPASRSHAVYWVMGGSALLAATGVAAYFLMFEPRSTPKDTVYDIPH